MLSLTPTRRGASRFHAQHFVTRAICARLSGLYAGVILKV